MSDIPASMKSTLTWGDDAAQPVSPSFVVDSMTLQDQVAWGFSAEGAMARGQPAYRLREAQSQMASAVAQAIESQGTLVVEAGTGVGKTYAYLVPVLLSGRRALISTATKGLQDQLYLRDLPHVRSALQVPVRTALLKGRESYLCLHRLKQARGERLSLTLPNVPADGGDAPKPSERTLQRIARWAQSTSTGDLSEVEGLEERSPMLASITSTRDNCLGSSCPDYQPCHVVRARREAMQADVVVVNHHLFFADLNLRETGVAELLPTVDVVIFDEAHQLVDTGVQFLGLTLSSAQALDVARDVLTVGLQHARGLAPWPEAAQGLDRAARNLRLAMAPEAAPRRGGATRLNWPQANSPLKGDLTQALEDLLSACAEAEHALETCTELHPAFVAMLERVRDLEHRASVLIQPMVDARVRWIDVTPHHIRLIETPLDIANALTEQREKSAKAWIFTSATLGDDAKLSWFTEPAGLASATLLRLGSPYDHEGNARLWVDVTAPRPDDPGHSDHVARQAARCAHALGGRTMVLTTTLRALPKIGEALRRYLREEAQSDGSGHAGSAIEVMCQGEHPKRVLIERLRQQDPGTVVVASQSFWEGVDVPGDALQCVVIDKLPFPPPNDPLIEARARRIEAEGGSAFSRCFLAEAAVSLKQGAGRLIRSESDQGLLVICDARMARMPYGKRLKSAMPAMQPVSDWAQAQAWLKTVALPKLPPG